MIFMNIIRSPVHFWTDCEKNKNVEIYTIDRLCSILHCEIEDIVEHIPEPDEMNEKQIRRIILLPLKMIKTLSDCKGMQLFVGCVIHVRKSFLCYYHFFTFQLDSFPESDICYSVKKNPFHSLSGNFTRFICVQGSFIQFIYSV